MAITQIISCDVCERQKGATNHWFVLVEPGGVDGFLGAIYSLSDMPADLVNQIQTGARKSTKVRHICGEQCLQKRISEIIAPGGRVLRGEA